MNTAVAILKRYRYFFVLLLVNAVVLFVYPEIGDRSLRISGANALEMLTIIPPIFVLLGLLDVWVERETMIRFMGEGSGIAGGAIAFLLGSAAAGPLYAAFPIAAMFLKKGASWLNVLLFIGAWSTTKLPLLLFETASLGFNFMALRFAFNIAGIIAIAVILGRTAICRTGSAG
jgi:uncharacterized membrane protein YraQ (UPF0718 family)